MNRRRYVPLLLILLLGTGRLEATTLDVCASATISTNSVANPTVVTTTAAHNLVTGQTLTISGSNSTPSLNGAQVVTVTGTTTFTVPVNVTVGGSAGTVACTYSNFQTAINASASGDTITLQPNQLFTGNFTLPNKGNGSVITITSNALAGNLPGVGVRTSPAYAAFLPRIQASAGGSPALQAQLNATKYTISNVEFLGNPGGYYALIALGYQDTTQYLSSQEPSNIVLDRVYIHADPVTGQKTAVQFNGNNLTLKNSYVDNIIAVGQDSQCLAGLNGTGTYTITNNRLECGTENIIFGGGDPTVRTYLTVTGSATVNGAAVATVEANHTLAELANGQLVAIETSTGVAEFATLTSQPGSGTTGTLAWTPAVSVAPAVNFRIRGGVVPKTITITGNHFTKNLAWMTDGVLTKPTGVTATPSTASGTLVAGTYWYRVQAFSTNGYNNSTVNSDVSAEAAATLNATGRVDLAWADTANETSYRVWCFTGTGLTAGNYIDIAANSTTFTDTGAIAWTAGAYTAGVRPAIKNLIELKAAQNVTISGNVFENQWKGSDIGYSMWLKSTNQDGNCWWCQTRDVTIQNNIYRHIDGWLLVSAREAYSGNAKPPSMTNVTIQNNLVYDSNGNWSQGAGAPYAMTISNGSTALQILHNTVVHLGNGMIQFGGSTHTGFVLRNNLLRKEFYGIMGDGTGEGNPTLADKAPGATFTNNALADANCAIYPASNFCEAAALWQAEFVGYSFDGANSDYHLKTTSQYHNAATDVTDLGANIDTVNTATLGVVQGTASATTPPVITTTSVPNGLANLAYPSTTLAATGGVVPYTWSVNSGSVLPTGLSFSSGGVLSGTPSVAGSYTFTLKVTDNSAQTATAAYAMTVAASVLITTASPLAGGEANSTYANTLAASGDAAPYTWAVTVGSLPTGISLSTAGVFSGAPTTAGTSVFTVQATGSLGSTATQPFSLTITTETRPCDRVGAYNRSEAILFRRKVAPTVADCVMRGDFWVDTSTAAPSLSIASSATPVVTWTPMTVQSSLSGDGHLLTSLNASELKNGTIPAAAFPNVLPGAVSFGASVSAPVVQSDYHDLNQTACATLSPLGAGRLCADAGSGQLKLSVNGGPYSSVSAPAGAVIQGGNSFAAPMLLGTKDAQHLDFLTNGVIHMTIWGQGTSAGNTYINPNNTNDIYSSWERDHTADTYSHGFTTSNGRKFYLASLTGTQQQACGFSDTSATTDWFFGCSTSVNSGSSWQPWFRLRMDGAIGLQNAPLLFNTAPTISSGFNVTGNTNAPRIEFNNGTAAFVVDVGDGTAASAGVVGMPTATNGYNCTVNNLTAAAAHRADNSRQTASSTTSVSLENQTTSTGQVANWAARDRLRLSCVAY